MLTTGQKPIIFGGDVAHRMVDFAQRNAQRAGVADVIEFRGGDALQRLPPVEGGGVKILNPPYGERIDVAGVAKNGGEFFSQLATHWKKNYAGWTAWVLTPDLKLPTRMRLKESRRVPMWNGPIECRLFKFDMVKGPRARHQPHCMIVIDTNIVLDLFVFRDPLALPLAQALTSQKYKWIATAPMRDELERVLDYPNIVLRLSGAQISAAQVLAQFDAQVQWMDVEPKAHLICRDPDDQKFIDLALAHQTMLLSKDRAVLCMAKRPLALELLLVVLLIR